MVGRDITGFPLSTWMCQSSWLLSIFAIWTNPGQNGSGFELTALSFFTALASGFTAYSSVRKCELELCPHLRLSSLRADLSLSSHFHHTSDSTRFMTKKTNIQIFAIVRQFTNYSYSNSYSMAFFSSNTLPAQAHHRLRNVGCLDLRNVLRALWLQAALDVQLVAVIACCFPGQHNAQNILECTSITS
jgi:hypothetical protein